MAVDMFLKIADLKGESKDSEHKEWIELQSWSWGLSQTGSARPGSGGGAGKVSMQDFHFTKQLDKSSPLLMQSCATGQHIKEATLHIARTRNDKQTYLVVTMSDVLVSSYQPSCPDSGAEAPAEEITLNFTKMEMQYKEIDPSTNRVVGEYKGDYFLKF